jgi:hypothetical protein
MVQLTAMDEHFVHQIPEPLPQVVTHHDHWRSRTSSCCTTSPIPVTWWC